MDLKRIDAHLAGIAERVAVPVDGTVRLNEPEVYGLCDLLGIERCPFAMLPLAAPAAERDHWTQQALALADPQGRLLLKVVGRDILHKTEAGGVAILELPPDVAAAYLQDRLEDLRAATGRTVGAASSEGVLAAGFVGHAANRPGQEVLVSLRQDPAFGPCVVIGIGGTLTEWYGGASGGGSTLILPARGLNAASVAGALAAHPWLSLLCAPSRLYPEPPLDVQVLVAAVTALGELGCHCSPDGPSPWTVEELEINPAVASGGRLVALDGVGLLSRRKWSAAPRSLDRIDALLAPRSAVVLGVSARSANPGRIILENLRRSAGPVRERLWVVHPQEKEIAGVPCVPDVASLPERCDLAVVAIPAGDAPPAIAELVAGDRAAAIILIPGGFAEAGRSDLAARIEADLAAGHRRPAGGPVLVGGNCLGIVSRDQYNTFFLPEYKLPFRPGRGGNLAVVSQSGAYLVTFASNYDGVIHPRASISCGNQMDLTVADFLVHFGGTDAVDVVACYVEGFRPGDGERFVAATREARRRDKRVVVFKAGRTPLGAQAAASHTASLAGDYAVAGSCLRAAGALVTGSLDEFEDLIKTCALLAGRAAGRGRVGIVSNAGFECGAVMDSLGHLPLAEFGRETRAELERLLPPYAHRDNPIDMTPMADTEAFAGCCRAVLADPGVDVAILSAVPVTPALDNLPRDPLGRHAEDLDAPASQAGRLLAVLETTAKPVVVVVDSGEIYDPLCRRLERAGVPVFRKIDRAARALAAFCRG